MSRPLDFTRLVAMGCVVFGVCYAFIVLQAKAASGTEYDRHRPYSQPYRPAAAPKARGEPLVRLRNDGRPFRLHVAPNRHSFVTASLYPLTRFVEMLGPCTDRWCYVGYGRAVGWLRTNRFRRDPSGSPTLLSHLRNSKQRERHRPAKLVDIALPVRKGRAPQRRKVVEIALPVRRSSVLPNRQFTGALRSAPKLENTRIEQRAYGLKELGGKIFLPVHQDHTDSSRVVGTLPFFATDIEAVGLCTEEWCLIRRGPVQGWVKRRFLTAAPVNVEPRLQLEPVMPVDALKVYSAPNEQAELLANIEPPVTNITPLKECDEQWCNIRHSGITGWVHPEYLTRQ